MENTHVKEWRKKRIIKTWRLMIRSRRWCGSYESGRIVQSNGTPPTKAPVWEQVGAGGGGGHCFRGW